MTTAGSGTSLEERYREAEARAEVQRRRRLRRQPWILIALTDVLILATAVTAAVDLRRLDTPGGVALAWTQAAVFGDCEDYRTYSVPDDPAADRRTSEQLCRDLRAATEDARAQSLTIGIVRGRVATTGDAATVELTVTRQAEPTSVLLSLERRGGTWRVLRNVEACRLGCA